MQAYEERRANKRPGIIRTLLSAIIPSGPPKQAMVTQQPTQQPVNGQHQQYASQGSQYNASPSYQQAPSYQQGPPQYQAQYQGSTQYQQPPHLQVSVV